MPRFGRHDMTKAAPTAGAFTLVEIIIVVLILGILAALVVPRFTSAAVVANAGALKADLKHVRTQVMVYRAHHGVSPGYPDGNTNASPTQEALVAQLTQFSDDKGATSSAASVEHRYGPYLSKFPANPINGSAEVKFIGENESLPTSPSGDEGWIYQPSTATVLANVQGEDETGRPFFEY